MCKGTVIKKESTISSIYEDANSHRQVTTYSSHRNTLESQGGGQIDVMSGTTTLYSPLDTKRSRPPPKNFNGMVRRGFGDYITREFDKAATPVKNTRTSVCDKNEINV